MGQLILLLRSLNLSHYSRVPPGRVFSRNILMDTIWGQEYYGIDRTIDTHVSRLRHKLGNLGTQIETVYGVGYRLKEKK